MSSAFADGTWPVDEGDLEMAAAINDARASLGIFFEAYQNPKPNQTALSLKVRFTDGERTEHIWLGDLDLTTDPGNGIVANETSFPGLTYMERVSFRPDQITDWLFFEDDKLVGGFTTRLLRQRYRPQ